MKRITGATRWTLNNPASGNIPNIIITFLRSRILLFVNPCANSPANSVACAGALRPAGRRTRFSLRGFVRRLLGFALLPVALLLGQQGVWAHGFSHDLNKLHGQSQNDLRHDCCIAFEAAGDAACAALPLPFSTPAPMEVHGGLAAGRTVRALVPYASRAPPRLS